MTFSYSFLLTGYFWHYFSFLILYEHVLGSGRQVKKSYLFFSLPIYDPGVLRADDGVLGDALVQQLLQVGLGGAGGEAVDDLEGTVVRRGIDFQCICNWGVLRRWSAG